MCACCVRNLCDLVFPLIFTLCLCELCPCCVLQSLTRELDQSQQPFCTGTARLMGRPAIRPATTLRVEVVMVAYHARHGAALQPKKGQLSSSISAIWKGKTTVISTTKPREVPASSSAIIQLYRDRPSIRNVESRQRIV